jgi:hypothetical protein
MVIIPHLPHSQDLAPCDFALFPKLKMKLNRRFETLSDIQRESPSGTRHSMFLLKHGKDDGITVYIPKETILQEMAAKIE